MNHRQLCSQCRRPGCKLSAEKGPTSGSYCHQPHDVPVWTCADHRKLLWLHTVQRDADALAGIPGVLMTSCMSSPCMMRAVVI